MVGWHHWLNGHEFEQTPGDSGGQKSLACYSPWGHKELDTIEQWTITIGSYTLIITLNVNELTAPAKRHTGWVDMKTRPVYTLSTRYWFQTYRHLNTENKGIEEIIPSNGNQKKVGRAILISGKIDFKTETVIKDKEGQYIRIRDSIQEEYITITNIYALNIGALQYVRQN